jgi:hypothetical protein
MLPHSRGYRAQDGGIHLFETALLQPRPSTIATCLDPADLLEDDPRIRLIRLRAQCPYYALSAAPAGTRPCVT